MDSKRGRPQGGVRQARGDRYLAAAGVAGAVCISEVLPVGIHDTVVGAAITPRAAGACMGPSRSEWVGPTREKAKTSGWGEREGLGGPGRTLTRGLGGMLAGGLRAGHSPTHGHPILAGAGSAWLAIRLPLDPISKFLSMEHADCSWDEVGRSGA